MTCEIWFEWYDHHSLLFKCLGTLFEKPFVKLLFDMPKSYQSHMMIYHENPLHICCLFLYWALSNCCDPWEFFSWSRFTCTPYTPLLCFFEKLALYHPLIPQNKCSTICVGLSLQFLLKKRETWSIKKNMDTWRSKYWKKKRKKMWAHEGPWKKR